MKKYLLTCLLLCISLYGWTQTDEELDYKYKAELSTSFRVNRPNLNILDGEEAVIDFVITRDEDGYSFEKNELPDGITAVEWRVNDEPFDSNEDNSFCYTASYDAEQSKQKIEIVLMKGDTQVRIYSNPLYFAVWEAIGDVNLNEPETTKENPKTLLEGNNWTLSVKTSGGNPDGWKYQWIYDEEPSGEEDSYTIEFDEEKAGMHHIVLRVTNVVPGNSEDISDEGETEDEDDSSDILFEREYNYWVKFETSEPEQIPETYNVELSTNYENKNLNILEGNTVDIDFEVTICKEDSEEPQGRNIIPDGMRIEWLLDDQLQDQTTDDNSFHYTATYNKENPKQVIRLRLYYNDEEVQDVNIDPLVFTVWPKIDDSSFEQELETNEKDEPKTLLKSGTWTVSVDQDELTGGNPDGWRMKWVENIAVSDEPEQLSEENTYIIEYDKEKRGVRNIQLVVENVVTDDDSDEEDVLYSRSFDYWVEFVMPEIELNVEVTVDANNNDNYGNNETVDAYDGQKVNVSFILKDPEHKELTKDQITNDYKWDWETDDNAVVSDIPNYSFTAKNDKNEDGIQKKITLHLTYKDDEEDPQNADTTVTIWMTPKCSVTEDTQASQDTVDDKPVWILEKKNKKLVFSAKPSGGIKDGWIYEWKEKDKNEALSEKSYCEIPYENRTEIMQLDLHVINKISDENIGLDQSYSYQIYFKPVEQYLVEYVSSWDKTDNNVLSGDSIQLEIKLIDTKTGKEVKDYSKFEWVKPSKTNRVTIQAKYDEQRQKMEYQPDVKSSDENEIDNKPFEYTVWPEIEEPLDWSMQLTDDNRNATVKKGIRAGNKISVNTDMLKLKGGYKPNEKAQYVYELRLGKDSEALEKKLPGNDKLKFDNGVYEDTLRCYALNMYNDSIVMGEMPIGKAYVKIYKKPETPQSLVMKGSGASGTWFVDNTDDIFMGYEGKDLNIDKKDTNKKWFISKDSKDVSDKQNLYIFRKNEYKDGTVITSGKCSKDGKLDIDWDGSVYPTDDELIESTSQRPSIAASQYSISGVKTNQMMRGLNIIRMDDGTVRKVFKK